MKKKSVPLKEYSVFFVKHLLKIVQRSNSLGLVFIDHSRENSYSISQDFLSQLCK